MSYLIDTNVISEVRKQTRCDANVATWFASVEDDDLFVSALVLGEIRKGIELARHRDATKASALESWLHQLQTSFDTRILAVDSAVADTWGHLAALRSIPVIDGLLAATAKVHDLTLVTRNEADVTGLGIRVLNPFHPAP